jgi:hypothetical protein
VSEATSLTKQYIDAVASDNIELIAKARNSILAVPGAANNPQIMAIFKATEAKVNALTQVILQQTVQTY